MRRDWRYRFQKNRSSHCTERYERRRESGEDATDSFPELSVVVELLLLQSIRDVVATVGEVERGGEEVRLEQAKEIRFVGVCEQFDGRSAIDGEDGEVGRSVDGRLQDSRDELPLRDHDEVIS